MSLVNECVQYAYHEFPPFSREQEEDLRHFCTYLESSLCAARGYGKTLIACIFETFMAKRGWRVCHMFKNLNQAAQWYVWMELLEWATTLWVARKGKFHVDLRLYQQGRGPRYDIIINDEVGTVVNPLERKRFFAAQKMLSGSKLGLAIWIGTMDPNSVWDKSPHQKVRSYDPKHMPWVTAAYEASLKRDPPWMTDQEFHCKATPAGGAVMQYVTREDHTFQSERYGIDSNPEAGYHVTGTRYIPQFNKIFVCEYLVFYTLKELGDWISKHQHFPIEVELNGVGGVVSQYLHERNLHFIETWVDESLKFDRVTSVACRPTIVPTGEKWDVFVKCLLRQIWNKDKTIEKLSDAHAFDSYYLSVHIHEGHFIPSQTHKLDEVGSPHIRELLARQNHRHN